MPVTVGIHLRSALSLLEEVVAITSWVAQPPADQVAAVAATMVPLGPGLRAKDMAEGKVVVVVAGGQAAVLEGRAHPWTVVASRGSA